MSTEHRVPPTDAALAREAARQVRDDLNRGILPTDVSPRLAWALSGFFLAVIFAVPIVQVAVELARGRRVQALAVFQRPPTRDNLHGYEKELDRQSVVKAAIQPRLQHMLSRTLRFGNTHVVQGRVGWLFYRPGVDFLAGPGLLDQSRLRQRTRELAAEQDRRPCPDPRPAIQAFHDVCRRAGVHLVVVPVPDKAMLQPGELTSRLAVAGACDVPIPADYRRLLADLRAGGVDVYDPTPPRLAAGEAPRYLRQDTHWTPEWMEAVARGVATHLHQTVRLPPERTRSFAMEETQVRRVGDLVDMLELPAGQNVFPPQTITLRRVLDPIRGGAWQPRPEADVLVLGDSFSNIYCAADMGWGDAAGFPAQLARFLGREIDVLARNGSGASATRRELARRPRPLVGKRVVVWQFAARELALANWEEVPFPEPLPGGRRAEPPSEAPATEPLVVDATVVAASRVPEPFSVPYKDCLTYVKVHVDRVVAGRYVPDQMIAVLWGMKDNAQLPAAHYTAGKQLRLKVVLLQRAPADLRIARSVDDLDDYDHLPYFALEEHER